MKPEEKRKHLSAMEAMLGRCRRRIKMAEIAADLKEGLWVFCIGLLVISGVFLLVRLLGAGVHMPFVVELTHALIVAALFGAAVFGRAVLLGFFGNPVHTSAAAERLDLSQSTHNRIATAMELLRSDDDSPFAILAIHEGYEYLEKLQSKDPQAEFTGRSLRHGRELLAFSAAMLVIGQLLGPVPGTPLPPPAQPGPAAVMLAVRPVGPTQPKDKTTPSQQEEPDDQPITSGILKKLDRDTDPSAESLEPDKQERTDTSGPLAQSTSGKARNSKSSSSSRSNAGAAGIKSDADKDDKPRKPKTSKPRRKTPGKPPKVVDPAGKKGGSINSRGSSGTGSMQTAQNDWENKIKGEASRDDDDADDEEEPDDESDLKKQRIGAQPSLKSRSSRVSRELSLAIGKKKGNEANRGRGGPSAAKKARGTATMIMGVPVPGFVKGALQPGPTKSTQEKVSPTPREGEYSQATILQPVATNESRVERYKPTAGMAVQARNYLINLHAKHEIKKKDSKKDD